MTKQTILDHIRAHVDSIKEAGSITMNVNPILFDLLDLVHFKRSSHSGYVSFISDTLAGVSAVVSNSDQNLETVAFLQGADNVTSIEVDVITALKDRKLLDVAGDAVMLLVEHSDQTQCPIVAHHGYIQLGHNEFTYDSLLFASLVRKLDPMMSLSHNMHAENSRAIDAIEKALHKENARLIEKHACWTLRYCGPQSSIVFNSVSVKEAKRNPFSALSVLIHLDLGIQYTSRDCLLSPELNNASVDFTLCVLKALCMRHNCKGTIL